MIMPDDMLDNNRMPAADGPESPAAGSKKLAVTAPDTASPESILAFGAGIQSTMAVMSNQLLKNAQKKDIREIGYIMASLAEKLSEVDPEDLKPRKLSFFAKLFGKKQPEAREVLSKLQRSGAAVDRISIKLERSKEVLKADLHTLEQLYEKTRDYYHELEAYIRAGEVFLKEMQAQLDSSAAKTRTIFEGNNLVDCVELMDKRLYDLKISREIALQSAAQIRMIQNSNHLLAEKIQSSIMTVIPLWKNQISISLSAVKKLHISEVQQHTEAGSGEHIEALKSLQNTLLETINETIRIQQEEAEKLEAAEHEMSVKKEF
ncbi:toxic anion resistance protein [Peribacillus sp. SCS-26]|uniref:toxic anion resistance protein n=1 Tax=Paraperibacillus marinus TaxID=3115295 RepID=UPI0039065500